CQGAESGAGGGREPLGRGPAPDARGRRRRQRAGRRVGDRSGAHAGSVPGRSALVNARSGPLTGYAHTRSRPQRARQPNFSIGELLSDGGAWSDEEAHPVFGESPMSRSSRPPARSSAPLIHARSSGRPSSAAELTWGLASEAFGA